VVSRARTADNAANLAPAFLEAVVARYAGTRLGRQELDGELIADRADALWSRDRLEAARVPAAPEALRRIVVAVDPPASSKAGADACGIVAAGLDAAGHAYVLADATLARAAPEAWASTALALYHRLAADSLVVEVNQGGEMATAVLHQVDAAVPVTPVRATRGKYLRAEPVSMLYAQGRVHHVGALPALEDELCDFGPDGLSSGASPDRLDALVWALTHLLLRSGPEPRIRRL
jgi:phage terminase large subunit-like protein